jgi:hypothetical protein
MVTRLCALWLAVLAALPFTAPFATLHLSDFAGGGRAQNVIEKIAAPTASDAQDDAADDIAASAAYFQRSHTLGACALALVASPVASDALVSAGSTLGVPLAASGPSPHDVLALTAILRL